MRQADPVMDEAAVDAEEKRRRRIVVIALLLVISLAAFDSSVVGPAMPTIIGHLGGLRLYSWVFSIYLLTSTVSVPIYGKLADIYGRKPLILWGSTVFLLGSMLCGAAQSMEMLIVFRAIQGLGAGALAPIAITIVGDLFSIEQRAQIQGLVSGTWGLAGVLGPVGGGFIVDAVGWRWIFYLNLPLGLASIALMTFCYVEASAKRRHVLDYVGAGLLSCSVLALLLVLLEFGPKFGWERAETLGLLAFSVSLLALFIVNETRAEEPMMPPSLFRSRAVIVSSLGVFVAGAVMFGVQSYVPLFEQGVFAGSATKAGLVLAPMSVSWILGSVGCGRVIVRYGYYPAAVWGGSFLFLGSLVLLLLSADTSILVAVAAGTIIGIGLGATLNTTLIAVQNSVEWDRRGTATASIQFFRTIGGSISIAVMGAMLNSRVTERLSSIADLPAGTRAEALLRPGTRAALAPEVLQAMQRALSASLHEMFFIVFAAGSLCFAILLFFPRVRAQNTASTPLRPRPNVVADAPE